MKNIDYWKDKIVLVTGSTGFYGHAVMEKLSKVGVRKVISPSHTLFDLTKEHEVNFLFTTTDPVDVVIHLAGLVGGILANKTRPGDFYYQNIMMGTLVMEYARKYGVKKLVTVAAGCGYPLNLDVPFKESEFFNGLQDDNSLPYSMAKKMLCVQSWAYRNQFGFDSTVLLPANLYGPWDNFDLETSHVVPALIRKVVEAHQNNSPTVTVWGSGNASREFLYVEDAAEVILRIAEVSHASGPFNLGTGIETKVKELVDTIIDIVGYKGEVIWDTSKPDGSPRRYYDMSLLKNEIGYVPSTDLRTGLEKTIQWYKENEL